MEKLQMSPRLCDCGTQVLTAVEILSLVPSIMRLMGHSVADMFGLREPGLSY